MKKKLLISIVGDIALGALAYFAFFKNNNGASNILLVYNIIAICFGIFLGIVMTLKPESFKKLDYSSYKSNMYVWYQNITNVLFIGLYAYFNWLWIAGLSAITILFWRAGVFAVLETQDTLDNETSAA